MAAIVILGPLILSRLSKPSIETTATASVASSETPQAAAPAQPLRSVSGSGIDADVLSVLRKDGTTTIRLSLNNHQYNLADPELASRTTFDGVPPSEWRILSSGSGGHHAEVEAIFDGERTGDLVLGVTQDITLTIPDL